MSKDALWFLKFWLYAWKHHFDRDKDQMLFAAALAGFIGGLIAGLFLLQVNWMSLIIVVVFSFLYGVSRLVEVDVLHGNPPQEHRGYFSRSKRFWMGIACAYLGILWIIVLGVIKFILNFASFLQVIASLPDLFGKFLSLVL
jgi:hypothetical protein